MRRAPAGTPSCTSCTGCRRRRSATPSSAGWPTRSRIPGSPRSSSRRRAPATTTPTPSTSTGARGGTGRRTSRPSSLGYVDAHFRTLARRQRPGDRRPVGGRLRRGGDRLPPPRSVRGDRVVVGLLRADRPDRARASSIGVAGREQPGEPARADRSERACDQGRTSVLRLLRRQRRHALPQRERPTRPGARRGPGRAHASTCTPGRHTTALWKRHAVTLAPARAAPALPGDAVTTA